MTITITIAEASEKDILQSIAAANNWPRGVAADTAERITAYMNATVAQWVKSGNEIMTREAADIALAKTIAGAVTIAIE